ncbi:hypothetical protein FV226_21435 [Methylobacterium sp. WL12]|uniref:hypothetical protein n=1 Tax=Methylobacterium sp. WL12 TaxID=2603890 RepID=UPI0011CBA2C2|nr:hypothetical protein [Methylobacterium sp. WL12]TXM67662.1 hypothetical protein FV226_21435 [Methylobacterium sp. WL12]
MTAPRLGQLPFATILCLVALPNLAFLTTHLASPLLGVACVACTVLGVLATLRAVLRQPVPLDGPLLVGALGVGFALCCVGGQAHVFYANDDWLIRDAVLRDLVAEPWPVGYRYLGEATTLRAPLGMYLVPAAFGKILGLRAAHVALLAQNAVLFGCLLYVFAQASTPRRAAWSVLAIFVLFGGWDVAGAWLLDEPLAFGTHLEHWMPGQQFTSHVTQVFWVPNHAASGWTFVAAYLLWHRRRLDLGGLVCVFGLCAFWSPLSLIGALPFLARAVFVDVERGRLRLRQMPAPIFVAVGLAPVLLYLLADGGRVPHGFAAIDASFVARYVLFLLVEIGPVLVILYTASRSDLHRRDSVLGGDMPLVILILSFVPLYRLGVLDFVMRASIPALALLALRFGEVATAPCGPRRRVATIAVVLLGAGAPIYEIGRAFLKPAFAISDCTLLDASRFPPNDGPLFHYLARKAVIESSVAGRILAVPQRVLEVSARPICWPDRVSETDPMKVAESLRSARN